MIIDRHFQNISLKLCICNNRKIILMKYKQKKIVVLIENHTREKKINSNFQKYIGFHKSEKYIVRNVIKFISNTYYTTSKAL